MNDHDVIIVGGGIAGLVAARELRSKGRSALILEGRDRLGGRTWYRRFPGVSQEIELGGTWVSERSHSFVMHELERYGIGLVPGGADPSAWVWDLSGTVTDRLPLDGDQLFELERALYRIMRAVERIDPTVPRDQQDLGDLDVSLTHFLASLNISDTTREFLEVFSALGSGTAPEDWSVLTAFSLMAASEGSALSWFAGVSHKIDGGTQALVDALLADGRPEVRLSTRVSEIVDEGDGASVVTEGGERFSATAVLVTAPVNTWESIRFDPPLKGAHAQIAQQKQPNRTHKLWILADGVPDGVFAIGSESALLHVLPQDRVGDRALLAAFSAPPNLIDPTDLEAVQSALVRYFPDATVRAVRAHDWNADPFSAGGWMNYRPGQLTRLHSGLQDPHGRVLFAGSDVAITWFGWIDGALQSGIAAAARIRSFE